MRRPPRVRAQQLCRRRVVPPLLRVVLWHQGARAGVPRRGCVPALSLSPRDSACQEGDTDAVSSLLAVARSLEFVRNASDDQLPPDEKADFFRSAAKNLGASALCLSGGASMSYYHFGVIRALLDEDRLPRVVTGTSGGAIVAALCCTRTDAELRELLVPELADRITACEERITVWAARAWRTGARFDTVEWARKASFFTLGSMTFREAFERTGRILNVSVIPSDTHSPTKLLNYLSAPDCVIYTAGALLSPSPSLSPSRSKPVAVSPPRPRADSKIPPLTPRPRSHRLGRRPRHPQPGRAPHQGQGGQAAPVGVPGQAQGRLAPGRHPPACVRLPLSLSLSLLRRAGAVELTP